MAAAFSQSRLLPRIFSGFTCPARQQARSANNHRVLSASFSAQSEPPKEETKVETSQGSSIPPLVVFGGNGYVGSHVCQEAIRCGLPVMSISRTGKPQNDDTAWVSQVEWVKGDALKPETYKDAVSKCLGLVSCIGLISTSQEDMLEINGTANKAIIETAADAGVQRMAYISAHDYQFPGDLVVMKGYFDGKRIAEAALTAKFPQGGVALRPGFIHGVRKWGTMSIPLSAVGSPLEKALSFLPTQSLSSIPLAGAAFVPPVSVQKVAKAAVSAATDPGVSPGVMDVWTISKV